VTATDHVQALLQWLAALPASWAYPALAVSAFLENLVPPVPGDTVVVLSAFLVGRGTLAAWPVFVSTWAGGTAGFMAVYWLGRRHGHALLSGRGGRLFGADRMRRAELWLRRYGLLLVLVNRFLSGIRTVVALAAGASRLPWAAVAAAATVATGLWNGALLALGVAVGSNWARVLDLLRTYNRALLLVLLLALAAFTLLGWRRRRRANASRP